MGPSVARSPHQTWRLAASGMLRGLGEPQGHRAEPRPARAPAARSGGLSPPARLSQTNPALSDRHIHSLRAAPSTKRGRWEGPVRGRAEADWALGSRRHVCPP